MAIHRARVPMLPIFILLVAALVLFYSTISRLFPFVIGLHPMWQKHAVDSNVKVWVNQRSGFYYCQDSALYGRLKPGVVMAQQKAREAGYSPAGQKYCP